MAFAFTPSGFESCPFGTSSPMMSTTPFGFLQPMPIPTTPFMFSLIHSAYMLGTIAPMDATSIEEAIERGVVDAAELL